MLMSNVYARVRGGVYHSNNRHIFDTLMVRNRVNFKKGQPYLYDLFYVTLHHTHTCSSSLCIRIYSSIRMKIINRSLCNLVRHLLCRIIYIRNLYMNSRTKQPFPFSVCIFLWSFGSDHRNDNTFHSIFSLYYVSLTDLNSNRYFSFSLHSFLSFYLHFISSSISIPKCS